MPASTSLSRRAWLGLSITTVLLATGCAVARPIRPVNADGTWCYRIANSRRHRRMCTAEPVPPGQVEALAKRFAPHPELLTLYVVRSRWGDSANIVRVSLADGPAADTLPRTFVRLRVPAGAHRLQAKWDDGEASLEVKGSAGGILFVELVGADWAWGGRYVLKAGDEATSRERVVAARMVADLG